MKNEQNVPQVRFKGFTDAWEQRELGDICEYHSSSLTAKDVYEDGSYDLYDANSLIGKTNKGCMEKDYITIIKDGAGVGRTRLLPKNSMFLGTMGALTPRNSDLDFLYQLITKADLGKTYTGSTIPHIYFKDYGKNIYCIPSCTEQQQIGSYFRNLDNLITLHQRKCETLQKLKKSMLQKMFPKNGSLYPEIRFAGFTDAWEQREVLDLLIQPITDGPHETPELVEDGIPFISVDAIVDNKIDFNRKRGNITESYNLECCKKYKPQLLDVFLVKSGSTVGKVAIVETTDNFNIWSPLAAMRCGDKTNPYFLYFLLQTRDMQAQVADKASNGTQPNLSMRELEKFGTTVPSSIDEQKVIGNYFKSLDHLITLHQRKLETLKKMKKSMLQKMFI